MGKYLNLDGLSAFLNKLDDTFIKKDDMESITVDEIDSICGTTIYTSEEVEL